jgi:hypothetical protein
MDANSAVQGDLQIVGHLQESARAQEGAKHEEGGHLMLESKYFWVPCTIENSGFSSERRFEVELPTNGKVVGAAYIEYFKDQDQQSLREGHPPYGQTVNGFVRCRLIRRHGDSMLIEFPGTDVFHVGQEALATSLPE